MSETVIPVISPASEASVLKAARRIVVKVGSSLVTNEGRGLDEQAIGQWSQELAALVQQGRELIMVSSGAVAEGMKRLGWTTRPKEIHELQAAAAVGQMGLVQMYETKLRECGVGSAQVLLTHADLADRERYLNARSTLLTLLQLGVVPVINENDTVVNDEIKFGDNDTLGDRSERSVHSRPAARSAGAVCALGARWRSATRSHGWRGRFGHRQGGHDHQDPGRQACGRFGCVHGDRMGA
jgi:glutamate 5-kinase